MCFIDESFAADEARSFDQRLGEFARHILFTSGSNGSSGKRAQSLHPTAPFPPALSSVSPPSNGRLDDQLLHLAPLSFDASTFSEIWSAPVFNGASSIIRCEDLSRLSDLHETLISRHGIYDDLADRSPFNQIDRHEPGNSPRVASDLTGGGRCQRATSAGARDLPPAHESSMVRADRNARPRNSPGSSTILTAIMAVPIGQPIAGTQVYVVCNQTTANSNRNPGELFQIADNQLSQFAPIGGSESSTSSNT